MQVSFDPLNYNEDRKAALKARKVYADQAKAEGRRVFAWTLPNQLKQYAGLGQYDGRVRNVYYLNID